MRSVSITKRTLTIIFIITLIFGLGNTLRSKEITDSNGKTVHTFKMSESMVRFVRIKGLKVLLYKDLKHLEVILTLKHKSFVQYLDRDSKYVKVRVYDGINEPADGWVSKYDLYTKSGSPKFYYGEPFQKIQEEDVIKDIPMDMTAWIIKDVTKLYYAPLPESDFKYEIYFGLRLNVKKQRGDYYFVNIYNSILDEYRSGWVRQEDTGTVEYFMKEYNKRRSEYDRQISSIDSKINEYEEFISDQKEDIAKYNEERENLLARKITALNKHKILKKKSREQYEAQLAESDREILLLKDKIKVKQDSIARIDSLINSYKNEITGDMEGIEKRELYIAELRQRIEEMKSGTYVQSEEEKKMEEEYIKQPKQKDTTEDKEICIDEKKELDEKMAEFENIRERMSGNTTKDEYNSLHKKYLSAWAEISALKKDLKKCRLYANSKHIALYNEAISLKRFEEYEEALELLFEAVEFKDDFDEGYYQIVSILIELDEDETINNYIDKISDEEMRLKLYYKRALNVRNSSPSQAINYFEKYASTDPANAYYQIGVIYATKFTDMKNAIKYYKRSLRFDFTDPKVLEAIGAAYLALKAEKGEEKDKNYKEGLTYLRKAYKNSDGYNNKGILCARLSQANNLLGKATTALKYAEEALSLPGNESLALAHLEKGKALIKMDRLREAKDHLEKAAADMLTRTEANYWLNEIK